MLSTWKSWAEREDIQNIDFPGVYVLSVTTKWLQGQPFSWIPEIQYIGMTCAVSGLKGRLRQFDDTIAGRRTNHGGADRVRYANRRYNQLIKCLYVSVHPIRCVPENITPRTLRSLGRVTRLEYDYLAQYVERFESLPKFNDKSKSPKYSYWKRKCAT